MPSDAQRPWYEHAVIYQLDVEIYQDSNGDGVGDFRGAQSRLDYIKDLGVDCVWVQPFYPTPNRDNGYDVADYRNVDPRFGTLEDFDAFVRAAHERGLRVILDIPLNHTSIDHAWFQEARRDRSSPFRDYYVWADEPPEDHDRFVIFPGVQESNWTYDEVAGQYYFHTFYKSMPDLNIANDLVCHELLDVVRFWMNRDIDGFRLDAVPFIVLDTSSSEHLKEPHDLLRKLNRLVRDIKPDAILLAEADKKPHEMRPFFGDGDEMHLLLNFYLCNHLFLALADGKAEPIARAWSELPVIPREGQWANFLRNHDELSLSQLEEDERQRVFAAFAPEEHMRAYERGIRRRLAPMLDGDPRRLRLAFSLLFSLPGTVVVYYGDEIGMGDMLSLPERVGVRTPMQWTPGKNGGFSTADSTVNPMISGGEFGFERVNVEAQEHDEESLLNFLRRAIRVYKQHPAFSGGHWEFMPSGDPGVLLHCCDYNGDRVYALNNLTGEPRSIRAHVLAGLREIMSDAAYPPSAGEEFSLNPFGFRWLRQEGTP